VFPTTLKTNNVQSYALFEAWAQLPLSKEEYLAKQSALQREYFPTTQPLPGVVDLLTKLKKAGVHIALATSSHRANYMLKTSHLDSLFSLFPESQRVLGDDSRIGPGRGKPAPDIYLLALETINTGLREKGEKEITPYECLVFEDSVPGVEAGRRAGMRVVWCPHQGLIGEFKGREEDVLAGVADGGFQEIEDAGALDVHGDKHFQGWPAKKGNGWGIHLETLVGFPYETFGIKA
jgi:pseudouridine 5'-phosphatase